MWGGGGGWEICDECSWALRPGGSCPWWVSKVHGGLKVSTGWVEGGGETGDGSEFKRQCLGEGRGRARTGGEHDHLD